MYICTVGRLTYFIRNTTMRDLRDSISEDDMLDSKVTTLELPELEEDWDNDVQDFLSEINSSDWD